jgi:hypothetical protein
VIKPSIVRWAGYVACVGERRGVHRVLVEKYEGKSHLADLDIDFRIILKWIFRRWDGSMDWIYLVHDWDRWWDLVNAVVDIRFPR